MYWLPKELQDYIYSYDDNVYYKNIYHHALKDLLHSHYRTTTEKVMRYIHIDYGIYLKHYTELYRGTYIPRMKMSLKKYIIERSRLISHHT